jgi:phage gp45-like
MTKDGSILLVAAFLVTIFSSVMFYSIRNSNTVSIKPQLNKNVMATQTNNTEVQGNVGDAQKSQQPTITFPKAQPPILAQSLPEYLTPNIPDEKKW